MVQTTTTGDVVSVEHAATSRNGNPTYRVRLADGREYLTGTDASIGYAATNYRPRWNSARKDHDAVPVELTIERGRIVNMTRIDTAASASRQHYIDTGAYLPTDGAL